MQAQSQAEEKGGKATSKRRRKLLAPTPLKVQVALGQVQFEDADASMGA